MTKGQARTVWTNQCAAASGIKERFGAQSALDYLVSEKLLNFAEAAGDRREFARELPAFVAEVRSIFSWLELDEHLSRMERELERDGAAESVGDADPPALIALRKERFHVVKQMLLEKRLRTS